MLGGFGNPERLANADDHEAGDYGVDYRPTDVVGEDQTVEPVGGERSRGAGDGGVAFFSPVGRP